MRRSIRIPVLLLAALGCSACEEGVPWGNGEEAAATETREDFGPTAAYARRLIFIGPGAQLPTAAIFDFTSLSDSVGVRRGVRARLLSGTAWETLMDAGWEFAPMREPWRIVPGDELRIVVDDAGELAAVAHDGPPDVRLEPGALMAESSPDGGTQFVLRQASLTVADDVVHGVLLDSQLGRAVHPAAVPRPLTPDTTDGDADGQGDGSGRNGRPTPIARAGAEAFLVNSAGYYAVFATSASGDIGWVSQGGVEEIHRGVALEPLPLASAGAPADDSAPTRDTTPTDDAPAGDAAVSDAPVAAAAGANPLMPDRWRIRGNGSGLSGELTAAATDPAPLPDMGDLTALGYILVSGWVEDDGVRRDVFGLIRMVR